MVRPCRHSRCHPGGAARASPKAQKPPWRSPPLFRKPRARSLHPLGIRLVAASVGERAAPGRIGEVIELHDKRAADNAPPYISIIIPVRNDAEALTRTLDHLDRLPGIESAEVFVAAAGDRQGTSLAVAGRAQLP